MKRRNTVRPLQRPV